MKPTDLKGELPQFVQYDLTGEVLETIKHCPAGTRECYHCFKCRYKDGTTGYFNISSLTPSTMQAYEQQNGARITDAQLIKKLMQGKGTIKPVEQVLPGQPALLLFTGLFPGKPKAAPRAINIRDVLRKQYKEVDLGPYTDILGDIEGKANIMAYGHSGSGKSVFVLQLINYLAGKYGKVLYNSHEEKINKTLQDRIRRFLKTPHIKVQFAPGWDFATLMERTDKNKYRVVVIDSVQYMNFTYKQLQEFRDKFKKRNIILVMVSFGKSAMQVKGQALDLLHASDVKLHFYKGVLTSTSRYLGAPKTVELFKPSKAEMELFDAELALPDIEPLKEGDNGTNEGVLEVASDTNKD